MLVSQSSAPSPTSMSEAFSLKQFGFNNALGDPNQLDYTMQDVSAFSKMETLPPMPMYNNNDNNSLYQQPPPPPPPQQQQQHNVNTSSQLLSFVPNTTTSVPPPPTSMPATHPLLDSNNEGLFRNNPNNPFFGIPTSMDWTEWNEWNQSNQGNTTWQTLA